MKVIGITTRERRRDKRLSARPITVELDGTRYRTLDCGLGGFLIGDYDGPLLPGDCAHVGIHVDDGRHAHAHVAEIMVVRLDRDYRELGARFIDIDEEAFHTLESWLSGRLGRAAIKGGN